MIQYTDGSLQEVDAFNKPRAIAQAIHGAGIMLVTPKSESRIVAGCWTCAHKHGSARSLSASCPRTLIHPRPLSTPEQVEGCRAAGHDVRPATWKETRP